MSECSYDLNGSGLMVIIQNSLYGFTLEGREFPTSSLEKCYESIEQTFNIDPPKQTNVLYYPNVIPGNTRVGEQIPMSEVQKEVKQALALHPYKFLIFFLMTHGVENDQLLLSSIMSQPGTQVAEGDGGADGDGDADGDNLPAVACCFSESCDKKVHKLSGDCFIRDLRKDIVVPLQEAMPNKPKLFFIQMSRKKVDRNQQNEAGTRWGGGPVPGIAQEADTFSVNACRDGEHQIDDPPQFIVKLCHEWKKLDQMGRIQDLAINTTRHLIGLGRGSDGLYNIPETTSTLKQHLPAAELLRKFNAPSGYQDYELQKVGLFVIIFNTEFGKSINSLEKYENLLANLIETFKLGKRADDGTKKIDGKRYKLFGNVLCYQNVRAAADQPSNQKDFETFEDAMAEVEAKLGTENREKYSFVALFLFSHGTYDGQFLLSSSPESNDPQWRSLKQHLIKPIQRVCKDRPKLFFIQACRGDYNSEFIPTPSMAEQEEPNLGSYEHEILAPDTFIAYSCLEGTATYVNTFLPDFTEIWKEHTNNFEATPTSQADVWIEDVFTDVTRRVTINNQMPYQVPETVSTLSKRLSVKEIIRSQLNYTKASQSETENAVAEQCTQ